MKYIEQWEVLRRKRRKGSFETSRVGQGSSGFRSRIRDGLIEKEIFDKVHEEVRNSMCEAAI